MNKEVKPLSSGAPLPGATQAPADPDLLNPLPALLAVLGLFALGFAFYYFWPVFVVMVVVLLGLLALSLVFEYPWAFIIAALLGGD